MREQYNLQTTLKKQKSVNYRIRAYKRPLLIRTPQWRYIQVVYVLFKFFQLERTKFEYTATLEPSKIYRTPSF